MPKKYVHMTSSAILPSLAKTKFTLADLNTLLYVYKLAPMAGEIFKGGTSGVSGKGATAFALLSYEETEHYNFDDLLRDYGKHAWQQTIFSDVDLQQEIDKMRQYGGIITQLRQFAVNLLRHQQMGLLQQISGDLGRSFLEELMQDFSPVIKQLIANYAIARYVEVIYDAEGETEGSVLFDENLFNIYQYLPDDFLMKTDAEQLEMMQKIPLSANFRIRDSVAEGYGDWNEDLKYQLGLALHFIGRSDFILHILQVVKKQNKSVDLEAVKSMIEDTVSNLFLAKQLLEDLLNNANKFEFPSEEKACIESLFPVAFIVEDESLLEPVQYEYRSKRNLALGTDIKLIATDAEHIEHLAAFCNRYDELRTVKICSFEELRTIHAVEEGRPYRNSALLNTFGAYAPSVPESVLKEVRTTILEQALTTSQVL